MPLNLDELRQKLGIKDDQVDALATLEDVVASYGDLEDGNDKLRKHNRILSRKRKSGPSADELRAMLDADPDELDDGDPLQSSLAELKKARAADAKAAAKLAQDLATLREEHGRLASERERQAKRLALDPVLSKRVREDLRQDAFEKLSEFLEREGDGYVVVGKDGNPLKTKEGKAVDFDGLVADLKTGELTGVTRPSYLLSHEGREMNNGPAPPAHLPGAVAGSMTRAEMREKYGPK